MTKIYVVVGYDYEYAHLKISFKNKKVADMVADTLTSDTSSYTYKVEEVELVE